MRKINHLFQSQLFYFSLLVLLFGCANKEVSTPSFNNTQVVDSSIAEFMEKAVLSDFEFKTLDTDVVKNEKKSVLRFTFKTLRDDLDDPNIKSNFRELLLKITPQLTNKDEYDIFELAITNSNTIESILQQVQKGALTN